MVSRGDGVESKTRDGVVHDQVRYLDLSPFRHDVQPPANQGRYRRRHFRERRYPPYIKPRAEPPSTWMVTPVT